ncbi:MAG TPA: DUF3578 domain-containing protein [Micromonosporaceae bacterium]|nr:DUF3578 domain-containing protein [Micromonosporaceae bacterium]
MRLRNLISDIGAKYDRRLPMSSEAQMLLRQASVEFDQWLPAGYQAEGSGGKGSAAVIPRIAVFNQDETITARRGIYLAYVFAADMGTVALTLNQGITEIAEVVGRTRARRALTWEANEIRAALKPRDLADLDTTIDLSSKTPMSVDYQHGNVLALTYRLKSLPSERTMQADLQRFIRLYTQAVEERARRRRRADPVAAKPARSRASKKAASNRKPKSPDARRRTPAERISRSKFTRRAVLVAAAAVPAALVAPALGKEPVQKDKTSPPPPAPPRPTDVVAPQFTVDVSQHDWNSRGGNLNWAAVRDAGISGMCARATYGDPSAFHYPSYHFGDLVRGAESAGLPIRGGYHNLVRGDQASINRQVDWLRRELDTYDANWAMLDIERYAELVSANAWPRWADVRRFDDRWAAVDHRVLVAYLPPWNWDKHLGHPDLRAFRGPLISSNYPLKKTSDAYRRLYTRCGGNKGIGWMSYGHRVSEGWQFSSRAKVAGAASLCDINAWRMTFDQLSALLTKAT